jgi:branched-chain amino acid transport system permease protein
MALLPDGSVMLQLLVAGIGTGSIYALIALGFNVVFKSTGAMNFAQGEWVVMGGMVSALLLGSFSSIGLACMIAVVLVAAFGLLSERAVIWPLRTPTPLLITLVSIGLSICTRSLVMLVLGKKPVGYPGFSDTASISLGGITLQSQTLWIVGLTMAFLIVMHLFFERSMLGKALRAAAADREAASIVGVKVETMILLSFGIAAFAGALAGAIITPLTLASYDQGAMFGFKGFSAAMLGGLGSLPGAVVGGLALGLLEAYGSFYISSDFKDAIAFAVLLLILFVRPSGLLGRADVVKV